MGNDLLVCIDISNAAGLERTARMSFRHRGERDWNPADIYVIGKNLRGLEDCFAAYCRKYKRGYGGKTGLMLRPFSRPIPAHQVPRAGYSASLKAFKAFVQLLLTLAGQLPGLM